MSFAASTIPPTNENDDGQISRSDMVFLTQHITDADEMDANELLASINMADDDFGSFCDQVLRVKLNVVRLAEETEQTKLAQATDLGDVLRVAMPDIPNIPEKPNIPEIAESPEVPSARKWREALHEASHDAPVSETHMPKKRKSRGRRSSKGSKQVYVVKGSNDSLGE